MKELKKVFTELQVVLECAIARGLAYSKYADLIWCETDKPDIEEAKIFAEAIKKEYPENF